MFTSKEITNRMVISINDGKKLGQIEDVYLDLDFRHVVGIYLGSEGLIRRKEKAILRSDVQVLGIDAWLVTNADAIVPLSTIPDSATFTLVNNIRGREIQTDGGTKLGVIEDVILNLDSRSLVFSLVKVYVSWTALLKEGVVVRDAVYD